MPVRRLIVPALVVAAAVACGGSSADATMGYIAMDSIGTAKVAGEMAIADAMPTAVPAVAGRAELQRAMRERAPQAPRPASVSAGEMLIRTGYVSVRVDSLEPAMAALRALATRLGGTVGNVSVAAGEYNVRSATLELRIPSQRFDEALTGVQPIGKIESSNVNAQDVGEEYTDINARIANAKRLEARLVDLLATRTGKLEDVLAVERELARVREEIERHEGRVRWLGSHVETSTISVTVSEKAPVIAQPGHSVLGDAFLRAWRNFVGLVAGTIAMLGVIIPVALVLAGVRWLWLRRRAGTSVEA